MANMTVSTSSGNDVTVQVTPTPRQNIEISRGLQGPSGPNAIGGYGFNITSPQNNDVLMFGGTAWVNTPQTEIADGGNF